MQDFNNDEINKMVEMLKEHADKQTNEEEIRPQATENSAHSDDDIKNMLKKHFSANTADGSFETGEDYSFDAVDFGKIDEEIFTDEIKGVDESFVEGTEENFEESTEEAVEVISEKAIEEEIVNEVVEETDKETFKEIIEDEIAEKAEDDIEDGLHDNFIDELTIQEVIGEIIGISEEISEPETLGEISEEAIEQELVDEEEILEKTEETVEKMATESSLTVDDAVDEVLDEAENTAFETVEEITEPYVDEATRPFVASAAEMAKLVEETDEIIDDGEPEDAYEDEPISEESINYDEVLEGQQGTVFNNFVEDFTGDLDDVVFEAEITESRAPDKQYTIFEDWEQLMKDKQYATAEEGIIPPTQEELARSAEIANAARGKTDYFNSVVVDKELDAVDIALMVALGGESELNQTVGFEKIRQAVHDSEKDETSALANKKIYGFCSEEYSSLAQNVKIKKKYSNDKKRILLQTIGTAIFALVLLAYEVIGWAGIELPGVFNIREYPYVHVLVGLQLLFLCIAISFNKIIKLGKDILGFSSISYISAMIASVLCVLHDVLILTTGYADAGTTLHSVAAFIILISLIYDIFDVYQQSGVFNIISLSDKKLVLEPYGKLRMGEEELHSDIIDQDSYCISRVPSISKYFARTAKPAENMTSKLISLIISFSVALCVMLVLLLMGENFETIVLSFIITLLFALVCGSIFESEFAFFTVYRALKRYKTGIIGKSSVAEYGRCNIVYFDDFNVFNKKSVRTKGLKLYDNNEIYRILYHTQAVFSKIGGPLKGVFEFATTEMVHSKNVEIKEISKEGIVAIVDNRTSVLIGTGTFMKSRGIHPSYTSADVKAEERGEESIMFIALNGTLGAKLYVTYHFSAEFEKLARKLTARGVGIGIRSSDPNINNKWAKKYGDAKRFSISIVRPTLKEFKPHEKSIEGGVVSTKNVRALSEALMMCIKLNAFETLISKARMVSIVLVGILSFALVLLSGINTVSILVLALATALCASIMMLLTHFYIKR